MNDYARMGAGMSRISQALWFTILSVLALGDALAAEEAKYTVVTAQGQFELRKYEPHILAETTVGGRFEDAGNAAFRRLFKYISGHNEQQQKLAMTSPVGQVPANQKIEMTSPVGQVERGGKWTVSFMLPASFTLDSTPVPKDPAVVIRQVPAHHIAAVRYSGFWSERAYRRNLETLEEWVEGQDFRALGEPIWARYNPPFLPWFLRRNEILLPVAAPGEAN